MKTTRAALAAIAMSAASALSVSADSAEHEASMAEIREFRIQRDGIAAIAYYGLMDYAKAKGGLDGCQRGLPPANLEALSIRYAEWRHPGTWAWITGVQSDAAEDARIAANLQYVTAKATAKCSTMMSQTLQLTSDGYLDIFEQVLSKPRP